MKDGNKTILVQVRTLLTLILNDNRKEQKWQEQFMKTLVLNSFWKK